MFYHNFVTINQLSQQQQQQQQQRFRSDYIAPSSYYIYEPSLYQQQKPYSTLNTLFWQDNSTCSSGYINSSLSSKSLLKQKQQQLRQPFKQIPQLQQTNLKREYNISDYDINNPQNKRFNRNRNNINDKLLISNRLKENANYLNRTTHSGGENVTFAAKNVDRVPESDTWQLHRDHVLVQNSSLNNSTEKVKTENDSKKRNSTTPGELKFAILRHGERVDLVFGPQWLDTSFDHHGNYRRNNLNLPHQLPQRSSKRDYNGDSPITEIGKVQAKFTGDALKTESFNFQYCYVSPSLRSIQTAHHVLEAMGLEKVCKIRIEPSLFEFLGWYEKGAPNFLNIESLISFGYNIDNNYKPLITADMLQADENYTDYYIRSYNLVKHMTNLHQRDGGHVLVVGHAATLEVCTRQITGQQIRTYADFNATIRKVPYLGCCVLQKTNETGFDIVPSNIPPLTHGATFNFDPMTLKI